MPIDEQQKNGLVTGFTALVRQAQLPGVEVQRLAMAFRMALDVVEPDQPIDLASLHEFLVTEQKVPARASIELCVILKSREDRLGVTFTVPPQAEQLPASEVERIVTAFNARSGAAWDKKGPEPAKPASGASPPSPSPSPYPRPRRGQVASDGRRTLVLSATLGVVVVLAVTFFVWRQANLGPPIVEVPVTPGASGLPCTKIVTNGSVAICDVPKAVAEGPPETLRAKARLTLDDLSSRGVKKVLVRLQGTGKIVLRAP